MVVQRGNKLMHLLAWKKDTLLDKEVGQEGNLELQLSTWVEQSWDTEQDDDIQHSEGWGDNQHSADENLDAETSVADKYFAGDTLLQRVRDL